MNGLRRRRPDHDRPAADRTESVDLPEGVDFHVGRAREADGPVAELAA